MASDNIRESIEKAKQYLSEHPDEARYTDQAATAVIEDGLRCRVEHTEGAIVITDMPTGVGGGSSAPSPGWLARAALAQLRRHRDRYACCGARQPAAEP